MPNADDVGYKKPPKKSQFKKGKSGNSKGRPKGSKNFLKIFEEKLNEKIVIIENGKRISVSKKDVLATSILNRALQGDKKCIEYALDMLAKIDAYIERQENPLLQRVVILPAKDPRPE